MIKAKGGQTLAFQQGQRYLLLSKAYESTENKIYATQFFREALKHNPECHEAFTRLTAGYLLTQCEKESLIQEV
jgi:hypothetical protein